MKGRTKKAVAASAVLLATAVAGTAASGGSALAAGPFGVTETKARLAPLNNSGVFGTAHVAVDDQRLHVEVNARGLLRGAPHAQHIHFGPKATHECPTVALDANTDQRLNTAEGVPAYGPVRVSLTTRGRTGPGSVLAVNRFPTAPRGMIDYERWTTTSSRVAEAIADGKAVVVLHGIDYNHNGTYDFRGAGRSELDRSLPAEATDTVACGVLRPHD